jgi:ribosomal protein L34E
MRPVSHSRNSKVGMRPKTELRPQREYGGVVNRQETGRSLVNDVEGERQAKSDPGNPQLECGRVAGYGG